MPTDYLIDGDPGVNIRAEMGRQRVSMVELSSRTLIPRSTLANQINNGTLTVASLLRIAAALSVNPSRLLPDTPEAASA